MKDAVDATVGPYRILRLINRGGQGSVFLGYDHRLRRRVAVKVCRRPPQRASRHRLLREARLVAGIESSKVVQIHDVIESSEHIALVMEYVPGCDLEEFLAVQRPSLASVLTVAADIAGALAVARQRHVVHGDLKAANILISESGRVKITDFGIARNAVGTVPQALAPGSLSAVSPEQYLGQPLDVRSDLFALGCLLYRMLTGEQAFLRGDRLDTTLLLGDSRSPMKERLAAEADLPADLVDLVTDLLQRDPQDRPDNTHRVRQVLRKLLRDIPLSASDSLLHQARPCFRPESAADFPLQIPADLGRDGHSRMSGREGGLWLLRRLFARLNWPARCALGLLIVLLPGVPLVLALQSGETTVRIDEPVLRVSADTDVPAEISSHWLVDQVKLALVERLGAIRVYGPVGATPRTTVYAGFDPQAPPAEFDEALQVDLRCTDTLCVFTVAREHHSAFRSQQALLFPGMPITQWQDIMRSATLGLFR